MFVVCLKCVLEGTKRDWSATSSSARGEKASGSEYEVTSSCTSSVSLSLEPSDQVDGREERLGTAGGGESNREARGPKVVAFMKRGGPKLVNEGLGSAERLSKKQRTNVAEAGMWEGQWVGGGWVV